MTQQINLTAGADEYTWPVTITETTGKDISGDVVQISLGSNNAPGTWQSPAVITHPIASQVVVQMKVPTTLAAGIYYVWVLVTDSAEVVPRQAHRVVVTSTVSAALSGPRSTSLTLTTSPTLTTAA